MVTAPSVIFVPITTFILSKEGKKGSIERTLISVHTSEALSYKPLDNKCCQDCKHCHLSQLPQLAQVHLLQEKYPRPLQLFGGMWWIAHLVHPLHIQLLNEAAAKMAQLIKGVFAMVTSHATVANTTEGQVTDGVVHQTVIGQQSTTRRF